VQNQTSGARSKFHGLAGVQDGGDMVLVLQSRIKIRRKLGVYPLTLVQLQNLSGLPESVTAIVPVCVV